MQQLRGIHIFICITFYTGLIEILLKFLNFQFSMYIVLSYSTWFYFTVAFVYDCYMRFLPTNERHLPAVPFIFGY